MQKSTKAQLRKGTWFAVASGLLYGLLSYFGVTLLSYGISVYNLSFWRFAIAFCLVATIIWFRRRKPTFNIQTALYTIANGAIFYSASGICFFLAVKYISTGQAMVIFFIYPVWVMLFNWLFEGYALKFHYLLSVVMILLGLVFMVDVDDVHFNYAGIGLSLLASFCYAIYIIWSKRMIISPLDSTMLVTLGCALAGLLLGWWENSLTIPTEFLPWLNILGLAIFCTAIPILLLLEAIRYLSSDKASLLSVLEPLSTVIFGIFLLGEVVYLNTVLGIALTLMGAMLVIVKWPEFLLAKFGKRSS